MNLDTMKGRVSYLLEMVPEVKDCPMLLNVLYWELFDGIKFPKELKQQLVVKGADPESLGRLLRFAVRQPAVKEKKDGEQYEHSSTDKK